MPRTARLSKGWQAETDWRSEVLRRVKGQSTGVFERCSAAWEPCRVRLHGL